MAEKSIGANRLLVKALREMLITVEPKNGASWGFCGFTNSRRHCGGDALGGVRGSGSRWTVPVAALDESIAALN